METNNTYRILIVEDERLLAYVLRGRLLAIGYQVVGIASNGVEAVKLSTTEHPDVVLMDIEMPEMGGIEATQRIMLDDPTCVVIISANGQNGLVAKAKDAGAMAYLIKPVSERQLVETIRTAREEFLSQQPQPQAC